MVRIRILLLLLGASLVLLAGYYGRFVPFSKQWPMFEGLRTTAAIIFAVVGAWLAIAYPERLKVSLGKKPEAKAPEGGLHVPLLMTPIAHSTGVLVSVLVVGLLAPLLAQLDIVRLHVEVARAISYMILALLTMWQVWTVASTLAPASTVSDDAIGQQVRAKHVGAVLGGAKVRKKKP